MKRLRALLLRVAGLFGDAQRERELAVSRAEYASVF
jgi:hypothetical protein